MADVETSEEAAETAEAGPDPETATAPTAGAEHGATEAMASAHHPKPSAYVGIAIILAIVTAVEVGLFYVDDISDTWNTVSLLVLMVVKFWLVASWFMHLRFDAPIFRRLFVGGIVLAISVYAIVLAVFHVFPVLVD